MEDNKAQVKDRDVYLDNVQKEIERRVEIIESPDYEYVPAMSRASKMLAILVGVGGFISIVVVYQLFT
jgi:hypothetical protein